jgi:hypothetical protein
MISAFVGFVFCDVSRLWSESARFVDVKEKVLENGEVIDKVVGVTEYTPTSGLVPVFVMAASALSMCICGILINKLKWKWVNDYALPICMIIGMAVAIPLTAWLGMEV